jgi:hypothetical protein
MTRAAEGPPRDQVASRRESAGDATVRQAMSTIRRPKDTPEDRHGVDSLLTDTAVTPLRQAASPPLPGPLARHMLASAPRLATLSVEEP